MKQDYETSNKTEYWSKLNYTAVFYKELLDLTEALKFSNDGGIDALETLKSSLLPSILLKINTKLSEIQVKWDNIVAQTPFPTFPLPTRESYIQTFQSKGKAQLNAGIKNTESLKIFQTIPEPDRTKIYNIFVLEGEWVISWNDFIKELNKSNVREQLIVIIQEHDKQQLLMDRMREVETGNMNER